MKDECGFWESVTRATCQSVETDPIGALDSVHDQIPEDSCQIRLTPPRVSAHNRCMSTTQKITTQSGSVYLIHDGDTLTRLSEVKMTGPAGVAIDTVIAGDPIERFLTSIVLGEPLRCVVLGEALRTSPVTSIEWS